jgi:hypothetical protein
MTKHSFVDSTTELLSSVDTAIRTAKIANKRSVLTEVFASAYEASNLVKNALPEKSRHLAATKAKLKVVSNLLGGIVDGLESKDLSLKELRSLSSELSTTHLPRFSAALASDLAQSLEQAKAELEEDTPLVKHIKTSLDSDLEETKASLSASKSFKDAMKEALDKLEKGGDERLPKAVEEGDPATTTDATRAYLKNVQALRSTIPTTVGKSGFNIIRLPVVPVFVAVDRKMGIGGGAPTLMKGQPNPAIVLKQAGIKTTRLEEYVIVDNQLLLAISKSTIPQKEITKGKRTKTVSMSSLEYAQLILSVIGESSNKQYSLVDDTPTTNPKNSDIVFFWVMPSKSLSFLLRKGFPKLKAWGLPF